MKRSAIWMMFALACFGPVAASAQLQLVPDREPQRVFAGGTRPIDLVWHNGGDQTFTGEIRARLLQTTSATAVLLGDKSWKKLQVLPGQTILESAALDFPMVKAETKFQIRWLDDTNHVLGKTEVLVYPTNLLAELKPLAGEEAVGVFDPQNQLKPLLKGLKLRFTDLENLGLKNFSGRLAVIGPFQSRAQMRDGLARQIKILAKKGTAIVWLQPPPEKRERLLPSFYTVMEHTNAVVVVQTGVVSNLTGNPQAQLNLIYLCKLALNPNAPDLTDLSPQQ